MLAGRTARGLPLERAVGTSRRESTASCGGPLARDKSAGSLEEERSEGAKMPVAALTLAIPFPVMATIICADSAYSGKQSFTAESKNRSSAEALLLSASLLASSWLIP